MYSEQLEQLIKSVIADGQITEKEREVLHKKATAEGVDEDEIDVYVSQMMSKNKKKTNANRKSSFDSMKCNKETLNNVVYYELKDCIIVYNNCGVFPNIKVSFIRVTESKYEEEIGLHLVICAGTSNNFSFWRKDTPTTLTLNVDKEVFELPKSDLQYALKYLESQRSNEMSIGLFCEAYRIDEEILSALCNAMECKMSFDVKYATGFDFDEYIKSAWGTLLTLGNNKNDYNENDLEWKFSEIKDASLPNISMYAQSAYHELVDSNTFPHLIDADLYSKILGENAQLVEDKKERTPCYRKYDDRESGLSVYRIKKAKQFKFSYRDFSHKLQLSMHAVCPANGVVYYFFELTYKYKCEEKRNDGYERRNILWLAEGAMQVIVDGIDKKIFSLHKDAYKLAGKKKMKRSNEIAYYQVPKALMELLASQKKFSCIPQVKQLHKIFPDAKSSKFEKLSISKTWKLAFNLLEQPEQKEKLLQEYHDSLLSTKIINFFKGLFGKK